MEANVKLIHTLNYYNKYHEYLSRQQMYDGLGNILHQQKGVVKDEQSPKCWGKVDFKCCFDKKLTYQSLL